MSKEKVEITIDGETFFVPHKVALALTPAAPNSSMFHVVDPARAQGATASAVVYNHDINPHSFDLGPIDPAAPSVRKRIKFPAATMEGRHTRVRSETEVKPGEWAILKEIPQFQALCANERTKDGREKPASNRMSFEVTK